MKRRHKREEINAYGTASELYNEMLRIYCDEYNDLSNAKRKEMDVKYDTVNLTLNTYDYTN